MNWIRFLMVIWLFVYAGEVWAQDCTVSATPLNFGNYNYSAVNPLDATGDISIACDSAILHATRLDAGNNSAGSFNPRRMQITGGGDTIIYNLYRDSARIEIWGNGTGSTYVQTGTGTLALIVYGRVPAMQNIRVGLYSDTITVTVDW